MLKQSLLLSLKIAAGTALMLTMLPFSAKAAIIGYSYKEGDVEYNLSSGDPDFESFINNNYNFWYNGVHKSTSIKGFDEAQQVTLDQAIPHQTINEWDDISNLLYLDPGMVVDSHMVYLAKPNSISERITAKATVKFSGTIVGLIGDSSLFYPYNDLFAPDATRDPNAYSAWTLEEKQSWTPLDYVEYVSEDTLYLDWTSHSSIDPLRVITISPTQSVPEPLTLLGAGSAIAMGGFFKFKIKNKAKDA